MAMDYRYIGKSQPLTDARAKAQGALKYTGDLELPNLLHLKLITSTIPNGLVTQIDYSEAVKLPGFAGYLDYRHVTNRKYARQRILFTEDCQPQESIFSDRVRFVGDRIGVVAASSAVMAEKAAALVKCAYQEFPYFTTPHQVLSKPGQWEYLFGADSVREGYFTSREPAACLKGGTRITSLVSMQRMHHAAMENHTYMADYDPASGKLTVWSPCQSAFSIRSTLAELLQLSYHQIRVIKTPMGGSFGGKQETILEPVVAAATMALGRPVKLVCSRRESMLCTIVKPPMEIEVASTVNADNIIEKIEVECLIDAGAYLTNSLDYAYAMFHKLGRVYRAAELSLRAKVVCTNNPVSGSFRSWGTMEMMMALEHNIEAAAKQLGLDPWQFRRLNAHAPHGHNHLSDISLGNSRLRDCLDLGARQFEWSKRRQELAVQRQELDYAARRIKKGLGMAIGSHANGQHPEMTERAVIDITMNEDGSFWANTCLYDHGCGTLTAFQLLLAEALCTAPANITVLEADTERSNFDYGCYASRTTFVVGEAARRCAEGLLGKIFSLAATALQLDEADLAAEDGLVYAKNDPQKCLSYAQVAAYQQSHYSNNLQYRLEHTADSNPGVTGVHFALVAVDTVSGLVRVEDYVAVHDIGQAINPEICRAQVGGAIQQGLGFALSEEIRMNPQNGKPLTHGLKGYLLHNCYDMPAPRVFFLEDILNTAAEGPYGAKSIGEVSITPSAPAVVAAVNDALGLCLCDLPLNPEKIKAALTNGGL